MTDGTMQPFRAFCDDFSTLKYRAMEEMLSCITGYREGGRMVA